jgi:hypothetical protein
MAAWGWSSRSSARFGQINMSVNIYFSLMTIAHAISAPLASLCAAVFYDYSDSLTSVSSYWALEGLFYSQQCLLALWFAFSDSRWWRSLPLLVVCILYLWTLRVIGFERYDSMNAYSECLHFGVPLLFAVLSIISRSTGIKVCRPTSNGPPREQAKAISSLRLWMLAILMLGISFKAAVIIRTGDRIASLYRDFIMVDATLVTIGFISVWAMLGRSRVVRRMPWIIVVTVSLASYNIHICGEVGRLFYREFFARYLIHAALISVSLFAVRLCGYRLVLQEDAGNR